MVQEQPRDAIGRYGEMLKDGLYEEFVEAPVDAPQDALIGAGREPISVAQVRRDLPVGTPVQVLYLGTDREPEMRLRTVAKQTDHEMITADESGHPVHNQWARIGAERAEDGTIILSDQMGTPYVAYRLLTDGREPIDPATPFDPDLISHRREAASTTDPARLEEISHSRLAVDRRTVASNGCASAETLERLARDDEVVVRRRVAENRDSPASALRVLATDPDEGDGPNETGVTFSVAGNPNTDSETLLRLSNHTNALVRSRVAAHPGTPTAALARLGEEPHEHELRLALASNPNTPPALLERWSSGNGFVMAAVAKNPSTPADVLTRLSTDTSTGNQVRAMVASNPATPEPVLNRLISSGDSWVAEKAAKNPSLPPELQRYLMQQGGRTTRGLAGNSGLVPTVAERLAKTGDSFTRSILAKTPAAPTAVLTALARDEFHAARAGAAANPRTPREVVASLLDDEAPNVRMAAAAALDRQPSDPGADASAGLDAWAIPSAGAGR